jgi:hypothetical protein
MPTTSFFSPEIEKNKTKSKKKPLKESTINFLNQRFANAEQEFSSNQNHQKNNNPVKLKEI